MSSYLQSLSGRLLVLEVLVSILMKNVLPEQKLLVNAALAQLANNLESIDGAAIETTRAADTMRKRMLSNCVVL